MSTPTLDYSLIEMIVITTNVDIIGLFDKTKIKQSKFPNIEFYSINEFIEGEKLQDFLIIFTPKHNKKDKVRKKGWFEEEIEFVNNYIKNGGKVIIVFPLNQILLDKFSVFYKIFDFSAVYNGTKKLLHVNPNMLFFNKNREGKLVEAKRFVDKYVHFLTEKKGEIIMEGNFLPVLLILTVEKGVLLLYGLGEEQFWNEDLETLFHYLNKDYEFFFQKINFNVEFFKSILYKNSDADSLKKQFISSFVKNKSLDEILNIKDEDFRKEILTLLDFNNFENAFQDLTGKKLENEFIKYRNILKSLKLDEAMEKLELSFIKKISEKKITYNQLIDIFEKNLLAPEAADLVVLYAEPVSPQDFNNYRKSIKKLIKWNETIKLFDENQLKNLLWEKLQQEDEKVKQWNKVQKERTLKEEAEKKKKEEEKKLYLEKIEKESLEKKQLEEKKRLEAEKRKMGMEELQIKLKEERQRKYEELHKQRAESEKSKEKNLELAKTRKLRLFKEQERRKRLVLLKRQKALEEEVRKLRAEKLKTQEESKIREEEYKKFEEERKIRIKTYKEQQERQRLEEKKRKEELDLLKEKRMAEVTSSISVQEKPVAITPEPLTTQSGIEEKTKEEIKPLITVPEEISTIQPKWVPTIPFTEELNELIDLLFKPFEYINTIMEYNKLLEDEKSTENIKEIILEFIDFVLNPIEFLETLNEFKKLDNLDKG